MKTNETYDKEILTAIETNTPAQLKEILAEMAAQGVKITDCMLSKNYLEEAFAVQAHDDFYVLLLEAGVDNHENLSEGNSVLYYLVEDQNVAAAELFLKHGADVNFSCNNEAFETHLEGAYTYDPVTRLPVPEEPVAIEYRGRYSIEKPLLCAAIEQYDTAPGKRIVNALLGVKNLDLLNHDELHDNAFAYAAAHGDPELLEKLAARAPEIVTASKNDNLLNIAIYNNKPDNLKYLLTSHKISPNGVSRVGAEDSLGMLLRLHNDIAERLEAASDVLPEDRAQDKKDLAALKTMYKMLMAHGATVSVKTQERYDQAVTLKEGFVSKEPPGRENN